MTRERIAKKGHNRVGGIAVEELTSIVERVEKLEEEKRGIASDIRDVYSEAKGKGFEVKVIREIIKQRRQDAQEREEYEAALMVYQRALGMIPELDL